jgi:hypothetical protein
VANNRHITHNPVIHNGGRVAPSFRIRGRMRTWNALRAASFEPTFACQKRQANMGHPGGHPQQVLSGFRRTLAESAAGVSH